MQQQQQHARFVHRGAQQQQLGSNDMACHHSASAFRTVHAFKLGCKCAPSAKATKRFMRTRRVRMCAHVFGACACVNCIIETFTCAQGFGEIDFLCVRARASIQVQ